MWFNRITRLINLSGSFNTFTVSFLLNVNANVYIVYQKIKRHSWFEISGSFRKVDGVWRCDNQNSSHLCLHHFTTCTIKSRALHDFNRSVFKKQQTQNTANKVRISAYMLVLSALLFVYLCAFLGVILLFFPPVLIPVTLTGLLTSTYATLTASVQTNMSTNFI